MKQSKWSVILVLSLVVTLVLAACGSDAEPTDAPQQPATAASEATESPEATETPAPTEAPPTTPLIVPLGADPDTMFPDYSQTALGSYMASMVYSSLTTVDMEGQVAPDLAKSWQVSDDQLTWTFYLVEDAKWHDGEPVTAHDVKFTFEFKADPEYTGGMYTNIASVAGVEAKQAGEADEIAGIEVIDDHTIAFTTSEPDALVLDTFASPNIVIYPEHLLNDVPVAELANSDYARMPVGSGPYKLAAWRSEEALEFEAHESYYGTVPIIRQVIMPIIPEPSAAVTALLNEEVHFLGSVSADDQPVVESAPGIETQALPGTQFLSLNFNLHSPLFQDVRVRQALAHALDRQAILDALYGGAGNVTNSIFHPSRPEHNPDVEGFEYDPEKAKAMLAEVGWEDRNDDGVLEAKGVEGVEDGTEFRFTLMTTTSPFYVQENQIIQQQLKAIGVETDINQQEFGTFFSDFVYPGGPWEATGMGWINLIGTPQMELGWRYMCPVDANEFGFCDPELDEMILANKDMFDDAERMANFYEIQEIIHDAALNVPLVRGESIVAFQETLEVPEFGTASDIYRSMPTWEWK
jgi:peptide/nickel transport system substrate-binding protein